MDLQKTCGHILFIKTIFMLISSLLLLFCGTVFASLSHTFKSETSNDAITNCSNVLSGTLFLIISIILFSIGIILIVITVIYWICSRRLIRLDFLPLGSIFTLIIFEIIFLITSLFGCVHYIVNSANSHIIIFLISLILLIQTSITIILLFKLKNLKN